MTHEWTDRQRRRCKVTARVNGEVVHLDTLDPAGADHRKKFVKAVRANHPDIPAEVIDAGLVNIATAATGDPRPDGGTARPSSDLAEIDAASVVRPELFHTAAVSGVTVAVMLDDGGRATPRWRTYLRWADGRREVIDTPDRLVLPDGSSLILRPDPAEPDGTEPAGWSAQARRKWIAGAAAPDPAAVFRRVCERVAEFLDFPPEAAPGTTAAVALWVMFTYTFRAWDALPYLYVGGPMSSGKTRLLDIIDRAAFRPLNTSNLTGPALFRTLHARGGTLIYDEAERLRQPTPEVGELNSMLLAGYRKSGRATRLEPVGDAYRSVSFDVYGPKVLACIAGLPPTLASRSIHITMFRCAEDSPKPARRVDADPAKWQAVRDDLHALALEYGPAWVELATRPGVVPAGVTGRNYELWQPLLALAEFVQDHGADGLLGKLQAHAIRSVADARDDAVPEADETLLDVLANEIRLGCCPTPGELLAKAEARDKATFKDWSANRVAFRLKKYGIRKSKKSNGERRYREVTPETLRQIEERYGIDLGFASADRLGDGRP